MANTTDLMITTFFDGKAIEYINTETGLDFRMFTDGHNSGGTHFIAFECFGTCLRSIGEEKIEHLIEVFKNAPFVWREYAFLFIDDDNGVYKGVISHL